ncbi:MAG: cytochrome c [Usitatibacter sp.]
MASLRNPLLLAALTAAAGIVLATPRTADGAEEVRGRALYESRCTSCHATSVHGRTKRVAADFEQVRAWVARWNRDIPVGWSDAEIDDVAAYLNNTYYHYPCPPTICRANM